MITDILIDSMPDLPKLLKSQLKIAIGEQIRLKERAAMAKDSLETALRAMSVSISNREDVNNIPDYNADKLTLHPITQVWLMAKSLLRHALAAKAKKPAA